MNKYEIYIHTTDGNVESFIVNEEQERSIRIAFDFSACPTLIVKGSDSRKFVFNKDNITFMTIKLL